jgi:flagellar FliL protein
MSEPAEAEAAPAKKSKKKLFIIIGIVLLLVGGSAAGWFLTQGGSHGKEVHVEPPKAPVFIPLETFTVNLQGGEQYLQTDITLQVADQAQIDAIKLYMPLVRSRLLSLLSSKHAEELAAAEDKKKLAHEIMAQMNKPFHSKGTPQLVDDVLFTTFVIQ